MLPALAAALAHLPADRPRYLMGVGDPASLVEAVALGVDQFDCVMQTRLGRHGTALTRRGKAAASRRPARATSDEPRRRRLRVRGVRPAQPRATCATCSRSASRPRRGCVSLHNVAWTLQLMDRMRAAIDDGTFDGLRRRGAGGLGMSDPSRVLVARLARRSITIAASPC